MRKKKIHSNDLPFDYNDTCLNPDLFYRYVEGSLSRNESKKVEKHLNECTHCLQEMVSLVRDSLTPIDKEEQIALLNIEKISPAEQVSKILAYQEPGCDSAKEAEQKRIIRTVSIWIGALKKFREGYAYGKLKFRPAMAVVALFLLTAGLFYGMNYFKIEYPIRQAQRLLKNNYRIYIENPRLSGGYPSTGISMLMSPVEASPSYLGTARNNLLTAVRHGSKSPTAIQLLAQIYLIEKNYIKADSLFCIIRSESVHAALVNNDLGVLYAEQKEWGKAAMQFQSALDADNHLFEACYNLALMKIKLGSTVEAISLLTTYIRLEPDEAWKDAARHILEKIGREKDSV